MTAQPTPPVQPAPPSGVRREAKQRQAATAKSEEGGADSEGASETKGSGGERVVSPNSDRGSHAYTRRDTARAAPAGFTASRPHAQPSAWVTGLEWGGGIGLMALALALGFTGVRPTPRRRPPVVPAPAWLRHRR